MNPLLNNSVIQIVFFVLFMPLPIGGPEEQKPYIRIYDVSYMVSVLTRFIALSESDIDCVITVKSPDVLVTHEKYKSQIIPEKNIDILIEMIKNNIGISKTNYGFAFDNTWTDGISSIVYRRGLLYIKCPRDVHDMINDPHYKDGIPEENEIIDSLHILH